MEAQLIVAVVAQKYRLDLVPGFPVEPEAMMTLQHDDTARTIYPTIVAES